MNIALRFRDTEEKLNTVNEHASIIESKGYVWWGWWKKQSEPVCDELWQSLLENKTYAQFYFFDRSTDRYYSVEINQILFDSGRLMKCQDEETTPAYYKDAALPVWLKVEKIEKIERTDFIEIFKAVPSGDATLFVEDVLIAELEAAKKVEFIPLESDIILHLSDIHFGADHGFPLESRPGKRSLLDILSDYVNNELRKQIGLVVISGDLSSRGDGGILFTHALPFLTSLCEKLRLKRDAVVIIPGNHDLPLGDASFHDYKHEATYKLFLREFYGKEKDLYGLEHYRAPCGKNIDILRVHSVRLRTKELSNYGYVDWFNYNNLLNAKECNGDIKIAVIHHHLVSMTIEEPFSEDYKFANVSVTLDAGRVIEGLQKFGFRYVLNGHQHIPGLTKITRGIVNEDNTELQDDSYLHILSAGSAGVKRERYSDQFNNNSFSIYIVNEDNVSVEVKSFNQSVNVRRYFKTVLLDDKVVV